MNRIRINVSELQQFAESLDVSVREMNLAIRTSCELVASIPSNTPKLNALKDNACVLSIQHGKQIAEGYEVSQFVKNTFNRFLQVESDLLNVIHTTDNQLDLNMPIIGGAIPLGSISNNVEGTRVPRVAPLLIPVLYAVLLRFTVKRLTARGIQLLIAKTTLATTAYHVARHRIALKFLKANERYFHRLPQITSGLNASIERWVMEPSFKPSDIMVFLLSEMTLKYPKIFVWKLATAIMVKYFLERAKENLRKERDKLYTLKSQQRYASDQLIMYNNAYMNAKTPRAKAEAHRSMIKWNAEVNRLRAKIITQENVVNKAKEQTQDSENLRKAKAWLDKYKKKIGWKE